MVVAAAVVEVVVDAQRQDEEGKEGGEALGGRNGVGRRNSSVLCKPIEEVSLTPAGRRN